MDCAAAGVGAGAPSAVGATGGLVPSGAIPGFKMPFFANWNGEFPSESADSGKVAGIGAPGGGAGMDIAASPNQRAAAAA